MSRGTDIMSKKSKIEQRETNINSNPRFDNSIQCSKNGWLGAHYQGLTTGVQWGKEEKNLHINTLELKAAELAFMTFTWLKTAKVVYIQMNNIAALTLLLKLRGMKSSEIN